MNVLNVPEGQQKAGLWGEPEAEKRVSMLPEASSKEFPPQPKADPPLAKTDTEAKGQAAR
jgi:hypothetical protein